MSSTDAPLRNLDVSGLPDHAFGHRSALWWGSVGIIVIEAAIFGVLIATYLYGMARADDRPPAAPPQLGYGLLATGLLVLSAWPHIAFRRATERIDLRRVRIWLAVAVALKTALLVVRGFEFLALEARWDDHFYGSILWTILGFHTLHLFSDWVETLVLLVMVLRQPFQPRRRADLFQAALFWNFAVVAWLPLFALIYLLPRVTS